MINVSKTLQQLKPRDFTRDINAYKVQSVFPFSLQTVDHKEKPNRLCGVQWYVLYTYLCVLC